MRSTHARVAGERDGRSKEIPKVALLGLGLYALAGLLTDYSFIPVSVYTWLRTAMVASVFVFSFVMSHRARTPVRALGEFRIAESVVVGLGLIAGLIASRALPEFRHALPALGLFAGVAVVTAIRVDEPN